MLHIQPAGWRVPVAAGQSLLEAAQAAGIRLPRSCRNGSCRTCGCRLLAGTVRYRVEWPGLLAEERAEGWVLPCVAVPEGDVTLEVPGAIRMSPRRVAARSNASSAATSASGRHRRKRSGRTPKTSPQAPTAAASNLPS
ncbi:MAG: 2Fe-2S iron-sulfur cluster binding domain-containing protein [Burkholderiales bacterium]|nr:2Fe-2S iron-sulfur cluster binding domain-containing protein [Burkholderiales bacterium]